MHGPGHFTWTSGVNVDHVLYEVPHPHKSHKSSHANVGNGKADPIVLTTRPDVPTGIFTPPVKNPEIPPVVKTTEVAKHTEVGGFAKRASASITGKKRSLMEPDAIKPTHSQHMEANADHNMDDPMDGTTVTGKVGTSSKVYARSVGSTTSDVTPRPISVARVSSKKRAETDNST